MEYTAVTGGGPHGSGMTAGRLSNVETARYPEVSLTNSEQINMAFDRTTKIISIRLAEAAQPHLRNPFDTSIFPLLRTGSSPPTAVEIKRMIMPVMTAMRIGRHVMGNTASYTMSKHTATGSRGGVFVRFSLEHASEDFAAFSEDMKRKFKIVLQGLEARRFAGQMEVLSRVASHAEVKVHLDSRDEGDAQNYNMPFVAADRLFGCIQKGSMAQMFESCIGDLGRYLALRPDYLIMPAGMFDTLRVNMQLTQVEIAASDLVRHLALDGSQAKTLASVPQGSQAKGWLSEALGVTIIPLPMGGRGAYNDGANAIGADMRRTVTKTRHGPINVSLDHLSKLVADRVRGIRHECPYVEMPAYGEGIWQRLTILDAMQPNSLLIGMEGQGFFQTDASPAGSTAIDLSPYSYHANVMDRARLDGYVVPGNTDFVTYTHLLQRAQAADHGAGVLANTGVQVFSEFFWGTGSMVGYITWVQDNAVRANARHGRDVARNMEGYLAACFESLNQGTRPADAVALLLGELYEFGATGTLPVSLRGDRTHLIKPAAYATGKYGRGAAANLADLENINVHLPDDGVINTDVKREVVVVLLLEYIRLHGLGNIEAECAIIAEWTRTTLLMLDLATYILVIGRILAVLSNTVAGALDVRGSPIVPSDDARDYIVAVGDGAGPAAPGGRPALALAAIQTTYTGRVNAADAATADADAARLAAQQAVDRIRNQEQETTRLSNALTAALAAVRTQTATLTVTMKAITESSVKTTTDTTSALQALESMLQSQGIAIGDVQGAASASTQAVVNALTNVVRGDEVKMLAATLSSNSREAAEITALATALQTDLTNRFIVESAAGDIAAIVAAVKAMKAATEALGRLAAASSTDLQAAAGHVGSAKRNLSAAVRSRDAYLGADLATLGTHIQAADPKTTLVVDFSVDSKLTQWLLKYRPAALSVAMGRARLTTNGQATAGSTTLLQQLSATMLSGEDAGLRASRFLCGAMLGHHMAEAGVYVGDNFAADRARVEIKLPNLRPALPAEVAFGLWSTAQVYSTVLGVQPILTNRNYWYETAVLQAATAAGNYTRFGTTADWVAYNALPQSVVNAANRVTAGLTTNNDYNMKVPFEAQRASGPVTSKRLMHLYAMQVLHPLFAVNPLPPLAARGLATLQTDIGHLNTAIGNDWKTLDTGITAARVRGVRLPAEPARPVEAWTVTVGGSADVTAGRLSGVRCAGYIRSYYANLATGDGALGRANTAAACAAVSGLAAAVIRLMLPNHEVLGLTMRSLERSFSLLGVPPPWQADIISAFSCNTHSPIAVYSPPSMPIGLSLVADPKVEQRHEGVHMAILDVHQDTLPVVLYPQHGMILSDVSVAGVTMGGNINLASSYSDFLHGIDSMAQGRPAGIRSDSEPKARHAVTNSFAFLRFLGEPSKNYISLSAGQTTPFLRAFSGCHEYMLEPSYRRYRGTTAHHMINPEYLEGWTTVPDGDVAQSANRPVEFNLRSRVISPISARGVYKRPVIDTTRGGFGEETVVSDVGVLGTIDGPHVFTHTMHMSTSGLVPRVR